MEARDVCVCGPDKLSQAQRPDVRGSQRLDRSLGVHYPRAQWAERNHQFSSGLFKARTSGDNECVRKSWLLTVLVLGPAMKEMVDDDILDVGLDLEDCAETGTRFVPWHAERSGRTLCQNSTCARRNPL
jgi:hypothetical protein